MKEQTLVERLDYSSKSVAVYVGNQRLFKEAKEEIERLHQAIYSANRTTPEHAKNILDTALRGG